MDTETNKFNCKLSGEQSLINHNQHNNNFVQIKANIQQITLNLVPSEP